MLCVCSENALTRCLRLPFTFVSSHDDMYVECGLYLNGQLLCPVQYTTYSKSQNKTLWREWIVFPVQYRDLTENAKIAITIWDIFSPRKPKVVGGFCFDVFDQRVSHFPRYSIDYLLKMSNQKFKVWRNQRPDVSNNSATPGEIEWRADDLDDITRIEQLVIEHHKKVGEEAAASRRKENHGLDRSGGGGGANGIGDFSQGGSKINDDRWLDHLSNISINNQKRELSDLTRVQRKSSAGLFLNVELLNFEYPVIYFDGHETSNRTSASKKQQKDDTKERMMQTIWLAEKTTDWKIIDPEMGKDNPAAVKHLKLTMHLSTGFLDRDLRPEAMEQRMLISIINSTPLQEITPEEKTIIWKYRYWLLSKKRALTKFLRCVDWAVIKESREASDLIVQWAEIDIVDALELLSKFYQNVDIVRNHAVQVLRRADNEQILSVLLQLVQALRYERDMRTCALTTFLLDRSLASFEIANNINWYLITESEDPLFGVMYAAVHRRFIEHIKKQSEQSNTQFIFLDQIFRQQTLVKNLKKLCGELDKYSREIKIKTLRQTISDIEQADASKVPAAWRGILKSSNGTDQKRDCLRLLINPSLVVKGINANDAIVFKSATNPIRLSFRTMDNQLYKVIFKIGDDLRQDQLIIQLITLMDKLLKKDGLDLKLTPYKVLACGKNEGFLEFVDGSKPFEAIIQKRNIRAWLEKKSKGNKKTFDIACDNFVRSCAGYCVITYILGIGDRHLENLLLTADGKLFHIDFGFILGRDPKHFAPPMKLCKEMVEGMGGRESPGYTRFLEMCCTAYNIMRKHSHWILNMFILMVDAGIKDIDEGVKNIEPESQPMNATDTDFLMTKMMEDARNKLGDARPENFKNIMKVQERLKTELSDEEANRFIQEVILESERALFAPIHDLTHRWAQYWRN